MKITAVLSGSSSTNFNGAIVMVSIGNTNVVMNPVGAGSSACTASATGTTCSITVEYYFVGTYNVPSDTAVGVYKIISTAVVNGDKKNAETNFQVGINYNDYVDVLVNPQEQYTTIGNEIDYDVTVKDKHPAMMCPTYQGNCNPQKYDYMIEVEGLPYNTITPSDVNVYAGGSETFKIKVFPSPIRTASGIATAVRTTTVSANTAERTVSITGKPIATGATTQAIINEAVFKFSVRASLREDLKVSDSSTGILHVKYVEQNQSPYFPQQENFIIYLVKGWNLVNMLGKGPGFTYGTCSEKPVGFVFMRSKESYLTIDEAMKSVGTQELLDHLSTHAFWVYSYEDCSIGYNVNGYSTYSGLDIYKGWNMVGVTKDMVGETIESIKGSCTFEKIYTWNAKTQGWTEKSENDLLEESGYGILLKANGDCNLKTNTIQPPPFPGE
jgi:hypothetical protein